MSIKKAGKVVSIALLTAILAALCASCAANPNEVQSMRMPSLAGATGWLNSPALTPSELRGKVVLVVLVDFWTYTCINWLRTMPHVRAWAERYKDRGLVVIGVHSPSERLRSSQPAIGRRIGSVQE